MYNCNCNCNSEPNATCKEYETKAKAASDEAKAVQLQADDLAAKASALDEKYLQLKPEVLAIWDEADRLNAIADQKIDYSNDSLYQASQCYGNVCSSHSQCVCKSYQDRATALKEQADVLYAKSKELSAKGAALNDIAIKTLAEADALWKEVDRLGKIATDKRTEATDLYNKAIACYKQDSGCGCYQNCGQYPSCGCNQGGCNQGCGCNPGCGC